MERDSQRNAVYAWEGTVKARWPGEAMPLDECRALVARVWGDYSPGVAPPQVTDGRGTRWARGSRRRVNLPRWARTPIVVLHETAHSLSPTGPWHGPEFATLVIELWARYTKIPKAEARRVGIQQRPRRVHFARLADVPKPRSRAYRKWSRERSAARTRLHELEAARPPR